jgi:hypothetical protein
MIKINTSFRFAERGVDVREYHAGSEIDVSDECAQIAIEQGWAEAANGAQTKSRDHAPENKAIESAAQNKSSGNKLINTVKGFFD